MSHLDPDLLALLALGESVASSDEQEHLRSCTYCTTEVDEMTHAVAVGRSTMDETAFDEPPVRVWQGIALELKLGSAVASDPLERTVPSGKPVTVLEDPRPRRRVHTRRTSMRTLWSLAASLAVVAAVGAGFWIAVTVTAPTSIASASLDAFPDHPDAVGTAEVEQARGGTLSLQVSLQGEVEAGDYREVWLIRADGSALISLGVLEGSEGTFPIPDGVDLAEYDLVDISFEPVDGDPTHSGDSIVRGQLSFA